VEPNQPISYFLVIWGKGKGGVSGGGVASRDWEVGTPRKGKC